MLGESVHPAVHHSVSVSKVTLHSFEQGRGLGSGIRTPSSQEGDRGVEKSLIILISKLVLLNQYPGKNTLKAILIWQGLYVLNFRYEPIILLEITKNIYNEK